MRGSLTAISAAKVRLGRGAAAATTTALALVCASAAAACGLVANARSDALSAWAGGTRRMTAMPPSPSRGAPRACAISLTNMNYAWYTDEIEVNLHTEQRPPKAKTALDRPCGQPCGRRKLAIAACSRSIAHHT